MYPPMGAANLYPPPHPQAADCQSSPLPADGTSIADFCTEYNLGTEVLEGLTMLQFQIGDDHQEITSKSVLEAKFAQHHWKQFYQAYSKYKHTKK